jgi:hypothetical protein
MIEPFAGAMVPGCRYRRDKRVQAIMVEINRRLYLRGQNSLRLPEVNVIAQQIKLCCMTAIKSNNAVGVYFCQRSLQGHAPCTSIIHEGGL